MSNPLGTVLLYLVLSLPLVGAYMMLGIGITMIYQSSRVLNLAHGAIAVAAAYATYQLATWRFALPLAVAGGVLAGGLLGLVIERVFVRGLRSSGPTTQTVGTAAALALTIAIAQRIWGALPVRAPEVLPPGALQLTGGFVAFDSLLIFPIALVIAAACFVLLRFTPIGLAMRAAAQNRLGAALRGVNPDRTTEVAWLLAGALAGLTGILLAGATELDPFSISLGVLPAFVAALVGGLDSLPGVMLGAALIGLVEGFVPALAAIPALAPIATAQGAPQFVLGAVALIVMAMRGARLAAGDVRAESVSGARTTVRRLARSSKGRTRTVVVVGVVAGLVLLPAIPRVPYDLVTTVILACEYCVVALSLVLLIGMVGQISLAQAAIVGLGAFLGALATRRLGWQFPYNVVVSTASGALIALVIGAVALRVRGLYLAVATLIFAYMADQFLFAQTWLVESQSGTTIAAETLGRPGTIPFLDLTDARVLYYVALAGAALALYGLANMRDSRLGRAWSAIRGSEIAAASLGIDVTRFKLLGFAVAGGLAGLGGGLILVTQRTIGPQQFDFSQSLDYLAIAAVGGLASIGGALAAGVFFAVLVGEVFFHFPRLADYLDLISASLLIVVLLFFRGGLGAIPDRISDLIARLRPEGSGRHRATSAQTSNEAATVVDGVTPREKPSLERIRQLAVSGEPPLSAIAGARRQPIIALADGVTVRFGGLTAVNGVSLQVGEGEIVGLIGPNGAGKTTMFNSILGLNVPTAGRVSLFGQDVTSWPVHKRAALGVGRTFQVIQLLPDLSVSENLLVATHLQGHAGLVRSLVASPGALKSEVEAAQRVAEVVDLLQLQDIADRPVGDLPFGMLRLIEVARTLVSGARFICFDEPASGLDTSESERLLSWFQLLRQAGLTLLVIEHDVDMVVRLCDYIYVLDRGELISEGTAVKIQSDPSVIASYLGTTEDVA